MSKKGIKPPTDKAQWTRSFPQDAVEDQDWMVSVIDDLHAYAVTHDLIDIADNLMKTRQTLIAQIHRRKH